jgi:hypothetical protein
MHAIVAIDTNFADQRRIPGVSGEDPGTRPADSLASCSEGVTAACDEIRTTR